MSQTFSVEGIDKNITKSGMNIELAFTWWTEMATNQFYVVILQYVYYVCYYLFVCTNLL